MEQGLDLDFPQKCIQAQDSIEDNLNVILKAVEVIKEETQYLGAENAIKAANSLELGVEESFAPSMKETAEFYVATANELNAVLAELN